METHLRGEVWADAAGRARELAESVSPGSLVALAWPHSYDLVATFIATMMAGAVPAILPYYRPDGAGDVYRGGVQSLLQRIRPEAVLTSEALLHALSSDLAGTGLRAIGLGPPTRLDHPPHPLPDPERVAYVQFSSGTTGTPRAVQVTNGAIMNFLRATVHGLEMPAGEVVVGWLPLHHDMGLVCHVLFPMALSASSVHIAPDHWVRQPASLFRAASDWDATMLWMPNFAFGHCARRVSDEQLDGVDLGSLRVVGCGAETAHRDTLHAFADRFAPWGLERSAILVGYGLAENVAGVTFTPVGRFPGEDWVSIQDLQEWGRAEPAEADGAGATCVMSCGLPPPGVEIRIVDAAGGILSERRVGRVEFRSDAMFAGYLGQPELTRDTLRNGWFRTGDIGYVAAGELHVCDRETDLIVVGGRNILPHDVERLTRAAVGPAAGRAAAFAVDDPGLGTQAAVVVCELREVPTGVELAALVARVRGSVLEGLGIAPGDIRLVSRGWIPRTTSGKTRRAESRRRYLEERAAREATLPGLSPDLPVENLVRGLLALTALRLGAGPMDPSENLFESGFDSLRLLSLLHEVEERVGRPLDFEGLLTDPTLEGLARAIHGSRAPAARAGSGRRGRNSRLPWPSVRAIPWSVATWLTETAARPLFRLAHPRRRLRRLQRFWALLDEPRRSEAGFLRRALAGSVEGRWRRTAFSRRLARNFDRVVAATGEAHLLEAHRRGRGVVLLLSHTHGAFVIKSLIERLGIADPVVVRGTRSRPGSPATLRLVRRLHAARAVLRQGGVIAMAGDGLQGSSPGIPVIFHGRRREFRAGFAQLAVETGATVVPVWTWLEDGVVRVRFAAPLPDSSEASRGARVQALVARYVEFLAEAWRERPEAVQPRHMARHLALPAVRESAAAGPAESPSVAPAERGPGGRRGQSQGDAAHREAGRGIH